MSKLVWHTDPNGLLCTELDCPRLTVGLIEQPAHQTKSLVLRQTTGLGAGGLIGSGIAIEGAGVAW
jgi:hypothetical protein